MNKRFGKGWFGESHRHFLASKGVSTKKFFSSKKTWFEQQSPVYQASVKAEEKYYEDAVDRYEKNLRGRKVLYEGHSADLVEETPTTREWISRVTGEIEREKLVDGKWVNDSSGDKGHKFFSDKDSSEFMSFDSNDLKAFDKQLKAAEDNGDNSFVFKGREVLTRYGHYVSEYLHSRGL